MLEFDSQKLEFVLVFGASAISSKMICIFDAHKHNVRCATQPPLALLPPLAMEIQKRTG